MMLFLKACGSFIAAFFRASDQEEGRSVKGFPNLVGWNRLENPYDRLFSSTRKTHAKKPQAALVFARGRSKGEAIYLENGSYTMGRGCTNDIIVSSEGTPEQLCTLSVEGDEVRLASFHSDAPVLINASPVESGTLYDHDLCEVSGVVFFFMHLRGDHAVS